MADSSTGGYLAPLVPDVVPVEGAAFSAFLQAVIVGITGLDAAAGVRLMYQPKPPPRPEPSVNYCGFWVTNLPTDDQPDTLQLEDRMRMTRSEQVELLCAFYGPACEAFATRWRDGLYVAQNREPMYHAGVALIRAGEPLHVPETRNGQFIDRWDVRATLNREIRREYAVLPFLGAVGEVVANRVTETLVRDFTAGDLFVEPEP